MRKAASVTCVKSWHTPWRASQAVWASSPTDVDPDMYVIRSFTNAQIVATASAGDIPATASRNSRCTAGSRWVRALGERYSS
jgi:hypothetical protein